MAGRKTTKEMVQILKDIKSIGLKIIKAQIKMLKDRL